MFKVIKGFTSWFDFKAGRYKTKYIAYQEFDFKHRDYPTFFISDSRQELEKKLSEQVQREDQNYLVFELKECLTVKSSTIVTKCEKCP